MAQVPIQRFALGDTVWFADGRAFLVTAVIFDGLDNIWRYALDGLPGFHRDDLLFAVNPIVDVPAPPPVTPPTPTAGLTAAEVQTLIDRSLAVAIPGLLAATRVAEDSAVARAEAAVDPRIEALSNSIIRNVTELSEIQSRLDSLDTVADETGDGGVFGFFRRIGGFIGAPFTSLLDVVSGFILREVRDGLNR